jgi:putative ABC transport system permease protein
VAGRFWAPGEAGPQASVEEGFARRTGLGLGSRLEFDVAGRPVAAEVTSLRAVDWVSMRPNFFVVLPAAVLGAAPQAHIGSLAVRDGPREAAFRRGLGAAYPNVSVIDAGRLLDQVREVLETVLAALRGLAWFCVAVGLLVMAGTLAVGHRERRRDAALLRALGAATRQLIAVDLAAFGAAGLATFVLGTGAAVLMGSLLARRLDVPFAPDAPGLLAVLAAALVLPAVVGFLVVSPAYRAPALETLRRDE